MPLTADQTRALRRATLTRRLAQARRELAFATRHPHPSAGRQAQRLRTLTHRIAGLTDALDGLAVKP